MKKNAFTLAELLIILAIIGILITTGICIMKPYDKTIRPLYSNIYHTLNVALYNSSLQSGVTSPFNEGGDATDLCKALVQFITTVEDPNTVCDSLNTVSSDGNDSDFENGNDNVAFTAINGAAFYLTDKIEGDGDPFYVIFVDISGIDKGSNSVIYEPNAVDPDVFAFAAISANRIVPLGAPEVDGKYMLTRALYAYSPCNPQPEFLRDAEGNQRVGTNGNPLIDLNGTERELTPILKEDGTQLIENGVPRWEEIPYNPDAPSCNEGLASMLDELEFSKVSEPYYITQAKSYGMYLNGFDATLCRNGPYTYNPYIRSVIGGSHIYDNVDDPEDLLPNNVTLNETRKCEECGTACTLFVDKYIH